MITEKEKNKYKGRETWDFTIISAAEYLRIEGRNKKIKLITRNLRKQVHS